MVYVICGYESLVTISEWQLSLPRQARRFLRSDLTLESRLERIQRWFEIDDGDECRAIHGVSLDPTEGDVAKVDG